MENLPSFIHKPSGTSDSASKPALLLTGAAGIIGPGLSRILRQKGWRVIATDRSQDCFDLYEKAFGHRVEADAIYPANLEQEDACRELVENVERDHGPISAIVNGATYSPALKLPDIVASEIERCFAVNFAAPIFLVQAALPSLIETRGSVINFSSVLVTEPRKGSLLYACSKAGLEKASEVMALELSASGVRVNTIRIGRVPGFAYLRDTIKILPQPLAQKIVEDLLPQRLEEMRSSFGDLAVGTPEDIAETVAFLLSPAARFINSQTLVLDGGYRPDPPPSKQALEDKIQDWLEKNYEAAEHVS